MPTQQRYWNELRQWSLVQGSSIVPPVAGTRTLLTSAAVFNYKPSNGSDSNDGSAASPWASPAPLAQRYDLGGQTVTLNLLENTTVGFVAPACTGGGRLILDLGAHSLAPTTVDAIAVTVPSTAVLRVQNGTLSSSAGACIAVSAPTQVETAGGLTFGAANFGHMTSGQSGIPSLGTVNTAPGGIINVLNSYSISGNARRNAMGTDGSSILFQNIIITLLASITCSDAFMVGRKNGTVTPAGINFSTGGFIVTGNSWGVDSGGGITGVGSITVGSGNYQTNGGWRT